MCETLILSALLGLCGGIIGGLMTKMVTPKQLKVKQFTIRYLKGNEDDWIIVYDKNNIELLSFSLNDTIGIKYFNYVK